MLWFIYNSDIEGGLLLEEDKKPFNLGSAFEKESLILGESKTLNAMWIRPILEQKYSMFVRFLVLTCN